MGSTVKRGLIVIEYVCSTCGTGFEAPDNLGDFAYGEFLLRSRRGTLAYLDANTDLTFKEVSSLLARFSSLRTLRPLEHAAYLHRVYGPAACDWDEGESPFEIGARPPCPGCGGHIVSSWRGKSPQEVVVVEMPPVTHVGWSKLTEVEKIKRLEAQLFG